VIQTTELVDCCLDECFGVIRVSDVTRLADDIPRGAFLYLCQRFPELRWISPVYDDVYTFLGQSFC